MNRKIGVPELDAVVAKLESGHRISESDSEKLLNAYAKRQYESAVLEEDIIKYRNLSGSLFKKVGNLLLDGSNEFQSIVASNPGSFYPLEISHAKSEIRKREAIQIAKKLDARNVYDYQHVDLLLGTPIAISNLEKTLQTRNVASSQLQDSWKNHQIADSLMQSDKYFESIVSYSEGAYLEAINSLKSAVKDTDLENDALKEYSSALAQLCAKNSLSLLRLIRFTHNSPTSKLYAYALSGIVRSIISKGKEIGDQFSIYPRSADLKTAREIITEIRQFDNEKILQYPQLIIAGEIDRCYGTYSIRNGEYSRGLAYHAMALASHQAFLDANIKVNTSDIFKEKICYRAIRASIEALNHLMLIGGGDTEFNKQIETCQETARTFIRPLHYKMRDKSN
jgi:hypothetical protein